MCLFAFGGTVQPTLSRTFSSGRTRHPSVDASWFDDADLACTVGSGHRLRQGRVSPFRWRIGLAYFGKWTYRDQGGSIGHLSKFTSSSEQDDSEQSKGPTNVRRPNRQQIPTTIARQHHVRTTVANQSRECALVNQYAKLRRIQSSLNGFFVRATPARNAGDRTGHGSVWKTRQWAGLTRYLMFVGMAAFYNTLTMELLVPLPSGDPKETKALVRKREERKKQSNIANLPATRCAMRKPSPRGKITRPRKLEPAACSHPEHSIQRGGSAKMYYERCQDCGSRWQRLPIAITLDNSQPAHTSTGKKTIKMETPFCPNGHGGMSMQVTT